jgi:predicted site-specific integrase-resolvase
MPLEIGDKTFYRTSEALKRAGISRATFFRWIREGIIEDVSHRDKRGWRLFTEEDITRIRNEAQAIAVLPSQEGIDFPE